ncbi:polysaccharide pyruvyl transferase family protein [Shewanella halotolerans]|uniref:polysaccharide pyruvyl transferase family protein n=1 Tax=Shewanella halotolerans TaxID=2864204 RepID=UPI001C659D65|nr:polysaccharide pyruvyl transferase family protein [Shewanella halotolerans]QYJ88700.1 polysaccharide pyruvyl transferase family protein [Shewanella halotolerans]
MNVTLVCESSSDNIGDQLIGEGAKFLFSNHRHSLCDLSFRDLKETSSNFFVKLYRRIYYASQCLKKSTDLVFCGGQLIHGNNYFYKNIFLWWIVAKYYKVNVSFFSVGCSGSYSLLERVVYSLMLKSSLVVLRDPISKKNFDANFSSHTVDLGTDMAFAFKKSNLLRVHSSDEVPKNVIVEGAVINPIDKNVVEYYIKKGESSYLSLEQYQEALNLIKETNPNYKLVFSTYDDGVKSREQVTLQKVVHQIKTADKAYCTRMHVAIIAHILGLQVEILPISEKLSCSSMYFLKQTPSYHNNLLKEVYEKYFTRN